MRIMVVVDAKSAAILLNLSINTARKKLKEIKKHYELEAHQKVCVSKFCEYYGLNLELVQERMRRRK